MEESSGLTKIFKDFSPDPVLLISLLRSERSRLKKKRGGEKRCVASTPLKAGKPIKI